MSEPDDLRDDKPASIPHSGSPTPFCSPFDRFANHDLASVEIPSMEPIKPIHTPKGAITGELSDVLEHWDGLQSYPDTCAIRCQEFVLECFTGQEIDEHQLVLEALEQGWYTPGGGTPMQHVGDLLDLHGIEVTRYQHCNIFHLADELAKGHKVIVGIDSSEVWCRDSSGAWLFEQVKDHFGFSETDHAVIVTGIDTSDPAHPQVIVTDPGTGESFARYPLERFVEAWRDSNFFMVATVEPTPLSLPEMLNFDVFQQMLYTTSGFPILEYLWRLSNEFESAAELPYALPTSDYGIGRSIGELRDIEYSENEPEDTAARAGEAMHQPNDDGMHDDSDLGYDEFLPE